jgi:Cu-Zn family superoxide dismutase
MASGEQTVAGRFRFPTFARSRCRPAATSARPESYAPVRTFAVPGDNRSGTLAAPPSTTHVVHFFPGEIMKQILRSLAAGAVLAGYASVAHGQAGAVADLAPTTGNNAKGTVTFKSQGDRVVVAAKVGGLAPGAHGFHIHEKGDCSSGDGMSAGGHFNPLGKPHGSPTAAERHAGDMPMLDADASGNATLEVTLDTITIGGGAADIVGRAVIVHTNPDDFKTQPTGNAGGRVACGVIRRM